MKNARLNIFTGHFGSGKSEIAVNYAIKLKETLDSVTLVDIDIVNAFFRSSDAVKILADNSIRLIKPLYANTNVDVPSLPAEINRAFDDKSSTVIFDAGGDEVGARVLARYKTGFEAEPYTMFLCVNTRRPFASTPDLIRNMISEIEASSRLKVTHLVSNTNILGATTPQIVLEGLEIVREVSDMTGIPIAFTAGFKNVLDEIRGICRCDLFYLQKYMRTP